MSASREMVRALVREELEERLRPSPPPHPALLVVLAPADQAPGEDPECSGDPELPVRRPCVIEPDRPCYNSGYCKRLGY